MIRAFNVREANAKRWIKISAVVLFTMICAWQPMVLVLSAGAVCAVLLGAGLPVFAVWLATGCDGNARQSSRIKGSRRGPDIPVTHARPQDELIASLRQRIRDLESSVDYLKFQLDECQQSTFDAECSLPCDYHDPGDLAVWDDDGGAR